MTNASFASTARRTAAVASCVIVLAGLGRLAVRQSDERGSDVDATHEPTARGVGPRRVEPQPTASVRPTIALEDAMTRIANDARSFGVVGQGYASVAAGGEVQVRVGERSTHVRVVRSAHEVELSFAGMSRTRTFSSDAAVHPTFGECDARGALLTDGTCLRRLEARRGDVVEWWDNRGHGVEHGFDVPRRPPGRGELELLVRVANSDIEIDEDALGATLLAAEDESIRYAGLVVRDALGHSVTAHFEPHPEGLVIAIRDLGVRYPLVVDPLLTSGRTTLSPGAGVTTFGTAVAGAGDVNGDGFGDVVVGAPGVSNGQSGEGRVYVYFGAASGGAASSPWTWEPNAADYEAGRSVASAGDVNGDGYADVIVGAPATTTILGGFAYVFYGGPSGLPAAPSFTKAGTTKGLESGTSVAGLGDTNGDGYGDFAIGSAFRVDVMRGRASASPVVDATIPAPDSSTDTRFGAAVSGGDVNNDGYADLVIGAPDYSNSSLLRPKEGGVFVYLGSAAGMATTPTQSYFGGVANALAGSSVAVLGDENGDGFRDFAYGAPGASALACSTCGRAMVVHGAATLAGSVFATVIGVSGDNLGTGVSSLGDVNGDGYADWATFTPSTPSSGGISGEGSVRVFYGNVSGTAAANAVPISGTGSSANISAIAGIGDVNGDGFHDLAIGSATAQGGIGGATGKVVLVMGRAASPKATVQASRDGTAASVNLGARVAFIGDTDGDGDAEFAAAAPGTTNGQAGEGSVEIYTGANGSVALPAAAAPVVRESNVASAAYGSALASAGDVNGDGLADVIVGASTLANGEVGEGRFDVYHGVLGTVLAASPNTSVESNMVNAALGSSAAAAGDVNGDGFGDVVVGAPGYANGQADEGAFYVYYGSASGLVLGTRTIVESNWAGAKLGAAVACAGDVNADGFDDIIVGAPGYSNGEASEGRVYVHLGSSLGVQTTAVYMREPDIANAELGAAVVGGFSLNGGPQTTGAAGAPGMMTMAGATGAVLVFVPMNGTPLGGAPIVLPGGAIGDRFGASLAVGDFTGDGRGDLLVGSPMATPPGLTNAGNVRLYIANNAGSYTPTPDVIWPGTVAGQRLGSSVTAGDIDGDGLAEMMAGAPLTTASLTAQGRVSIARSNSGDFTSGGTRGSFQPQMRVGGSSAGVQPRGSLFGTSASFLLSASTHAFAGLQTKLELDVQPRGVAFGALGQSLSATAQSQAGATSVTVSGLAVQSTVHARGRLRLAAVAAPPFQWTRWIYYGQSGDGAGNHLRTTAAVVDSDADGLNDATEMNIGTNPNNPDSDGDGIADGVEVGPIVTSPRNTDATGLIDALDTDSDNDSILDSVESLLDPDADGLPAYRDLDSDGDSVSDATEGGSTDTDLDLFPNFLDDDDDDDGIVTKTECVAEPCVNTDLTGLPDYLDTDADDDSILDSIEGTIDPEPDGRGAWIDTDADGNGILDSVEGTGNADGDAYADFVDLDDDADGVNDASDNCRVDANASQLNTDGDALGNACDPDDDNDGVNDVGDNCALIANPTQADNEPDGSGDVCDADDDNDGVLDITDNCQFASNATQTNTDMIADGGDACDSDDDNDGVLDVADNCPLVVNSTQADIDADSMGDSCDPDDDNDGVVDGTDNCPRIANATQTDTDGDGLGDACDNCASGDSDSDGACNNVDNCPSVSNADQANMDGDTLGDLCDTCPADSANDADVDTICGNVDNCPATANTSQANADVDSLGDACDACPADPLNDMDLDTVCGNVDNCPIVANTSQTDGDSDGTGDACDVCSADALNDADADGVCGNLDNCPSAANASQLNTDGDGLGDVCDACITDAMNDVDMDGVCGDTDNCPSVANPDQQDTDPTDPRGDACQNCPDEDTDGVCTSQSAILDNCPNEANSDQANADSDAKGDVCDSCPNDASDDADADEVCGDVDNCPSIANANQADIDGDGTGDACEALPDGGIRVAVDASLESVPTHIDPGGCACNLAGSERPSPSPWFGVGLVGLLWLRRARRGRSRGVAVVALAALVAGCGQIIGSSDYKTSALGPCDANYVLDPQGIVCMYDVTALETLTPSIGTLSPAFDPSIATYQLDLDVLTRTVRFTPTVLEPSHATVKVNGQVVASGAESQSINLTVGDQVLSLEIESESGNLATYTVHISRGHLDSYVKASNTDAGDLFGTSVAISGDLLAIGAPHEDSNGTSPANSATYQDSGAVYVYTRDVSSGEWRFEALIKAEDVRAGDAFGRSVALDGTTLVVGAPLANNSSAVDSGATYVFTRDTAGDWSQEARLRASNYGMNDEFGSVVAIAADVVVVGAPKEDSSVAGVNAPGSDDASLDSGAVYVFRRASGLWSQESLIKAHDADDGDAFGSAIAISGTTVLVGAPHSDDSRSGPVSGTPSVDENLMDSGSVYAFGYTSSWTQTAYLKPTGPEDGDGFGSSLAIEGDRAVVGAPFEDSAVEGGVIVAATLTSTDSGAAYYFVRTAGTWGNADTFKAATADGGDQFGASVAIESTATDVELVVGAPYEDGSASLLGAMGTSNSVVDSGAVYIFRATSSGVLQTAYVKSVLSTEDYAFGASVALDGSELVVASPMDASTATGIDGDYALMGAADAGGVFLYR